MSARFTIDGGDKLEEELSALCRRVSDGVRSIILERTLEAIVLAGGYGRGEGGVLLTSEGDKPYNDIEFYLFIKGSALMNQRRYGKALNRLADDLSGDAAVIANVVARVRKCNAIGGPRWNRNEEKENEEKDEESCSTA